jgi:endonuclease/exonuclease/phosphatase family metal-dependent hydrolase
VLTWNLYHGRAVPPAGRALLGSFAAALASWEWDVALLQEVPPWWPGPLAAFTGADERHVLTSRNLALPLRRAIAVRDPDLLGANGGGANAILVRGAIREHRRVLLRRLPERRRAHGVRLADGTWVVNVHAHNAPPALALADCERARAAALGWAAGAPLVLGGDLNVRRPVLAGLHHVAGNHVDHLLARGLDGRGRVLDRGRLSDHPPVVATLE